MMSFASRYATLRASLSIAAAMGLSFGVAMSSAQAQTPAPAQAPARTAPARPAKPKPPAPAPAQQAQQPQQQGGANEAAPASGPTVVQLKAGADGTDWTKQCGRDDAKKIESCVTVREFSSDSDQPVLAIAFSEVKAQQGVERRMRVVLPFGLALESGVRFSVDRSGYVAGKFTVCMPNGCFADIGLKDDVFKAMKNATTFNVNVRNIAGNEVVFAVPAAGFGKAADGPAVDPKVLKEREEQFKRDLQHQSEQMQKDLEARGAGGMPAPAPAPSPAPRRQ